MRFFNLFAAAISLSVVLIGCGDDDDSPSGPGTQPPVASFSMEGGTVTPATVAFVNTSTNADRYFWDFGDGRTSIQVSPGMAFSVWGDYHVTLVATQSSTGISDTVAHSLVITPGQVRMDTVWVEAMPFTDSQGSGWDLASGPDLFLQFILNSNVLTTSSTLTDLSPSDLPVGWLYNPGRTLSDWSGTYGFWLWDYDGASNHDYIGGVGFTVNSIIGNVGYQPRVILTDPNHTVRLRITLTWL